MGYSMPSSLSFTVSGSLLKLISTESLMPSNLDILCHPLLLLPSIFLSISVFSNELALQIRRPKYCSLSFNISPSNEYSGLISFKIDWQCIYSVLEFKWIVSYDRFDWMTLALLSSSPKIMEKSLAMFYIWDVLSVWFVWGLDFSV